jgi:hypothetical protein
MAGLPGSGLGGVFYILLLLWMFLRQAFTGRLSPGQCRQMMPLVFMSVAMIAVLTAMAWLVARVVGPLPTFASVVAPTYGAGRLAMVLGTMPLISIAILLCGLQVARLVIPRSSAP